MEVKTRYFAQLRAALGGVGEEVLTLPAGATVGGLVDLVEERHGAAVKAFRGSLLFSRNQEWAEPDTLLEEGDEVGLMPPLSGG